MNRRQWVLGAAASAASPWVRALPAYPDHPIRLIYNFAPGGPGDAVARYLARQMGEALGQPLVVENQSGGNGVVGILATARSAPDGYTLLFTALTGIVQVPLLTRDAGFDPFKSVLPIANVGSAPLAIVASSAVPASDFPGFLDWARTLPSGVDVAGAGSIVEIATAVLARQAKVNLVWVSYRGTAPALQAVLAGDVKVAFLTPSALLSEHVNAGKVKVIGITSTGPSTLFPGVSPIQPYVPGYVQEINYALWAPGGTAPAVANALQAAVVKVMAQPDMAEKLRINGMVKDYRDGPAVVAIARQQDRNIREVLATTSIKLGG